MRWYFKNFSIRIGLGRYTSWSWSRMVIPFPFALNLHELQIEEGRCPTESLFGTNHAFNLSLSHQEGQGWSLGSFLASNHINFKVCTKNRQMNSSYNFLLLKVCLTEVFVLLRHFREHFEKVRNDNFNLEASYLLHFFHIISNAMFSEFLRFL